MAFVNQENIEKANTIHENTTNNPLSKIFLESMIDAFFDPIDKIFSPTDYYLGDILAGSLLFIISLEVSILIYCISSPNILFTWGTITFIMFDSLAIILLRSQFRNYRQLYKLNLVPIKPDSKHEDWYDDRVKDNRFYESVTIKLFKRKYWVSAPSLFGTVFSASFIILLLALVILELILLITFIVSIILSIINGNLSSNLTILTSNVYKIFIAPISSEIFFIFFSIAMFIIGNLIMICQDTLYSVFKITYQYKIKIDFADELGGTDVFGKIIISTLYLATLTSLVLPASQTLSEVANANIPLNNFNNVLQLIQTNHWNIAIYFIYSLVFLLFVSLSILSIFGVHRQLKVAKEEELHNISSKLKITDYNTDLEHDQHTQHLLILYDKISSMKEWPFKLDFIIYILISILIPVLTLYFQVFPLK